MGAREGGKGEETWIDMLDKLVSNLNSKKYTSFKKEVVS